MFFFVDSRAWSSEKKIEKLYISSMRCWEKEQSGYRIYCNDISFERPEKASTVIKLRPAIKDPSSPHLHFAHPLSQYVSNYLL